VLVGNERAQRFYAAAGFTPDARVPEQPFRDTGAWKRRMVRRLP
jgi:RimJ/RimL family protein N-acetyltransferase